MNLAIVEENAEHWVADNTIECKRFRARISHAACSNYQRLSVVKGRDLHCEGCGGLDKQPVPLSLRAAVPPEPSHQKVEVDQSKGISEASELDCDVDLDDETLFKLFPEFAAELEAMDDLPPAQEEEPTQHRKVAVFMGRCPRCGGYMQNDIERQFAVRDEDVYRCFTCGWRTSPAYKWNRENPTAAAKR